MAVNPCGDNDDSFLYDCDEVPFDEIPPEPGREIKDSGFGELVIRVHNDSNKETEGYPSNNEASSSKNSNARYIGPLQRTIHQPEQTRHPSYDNVSNSPSNSRHIGPLQKTIHPTEQASHEPKVIDENEVSSISSLANVTCGVSTLKQTNGQIPSVNQTFVGTRSYKTDNCEKSKAPISSTTSDVAKEGPTDFEVDQEFQLSFDSQMFSFPEEALNEDEIEWSEEEMQSEEDKNDMQEEADTVGPNLIKETPEVLKETETIPGQAVKGKSLSYHLQFLSDAAHSKEGRLTYLQSLREVAHHYQAFKEAKKEPSAKLTSYKKEIIEPDKRLKQPSKRFLKVEAPVLHTLLNVLNFIPDLDSKNKVIAWLMHPQNSKQLAHLFKTVLNSKTLWQHIIKKSRQKILKGLIIPKTSTQDELAFPVVPLKKVKMNRDFVVHQKCPFYHEKKLCRYKITGLQGVVKNILQKYDIPVKTSYRGSRKVNFPEEYTSTSSVQVPNDETSIPVVEEPIILDL